ncbi:hypothetical protein CBL_21522 [Carabus blaptoides fortunei]
MGVMPSKIRKCKHCGLRPVSGKCTLCAEKIKSDALWPCKHRTRACPVQLKWTELKHHEKTCEFARLPCDNPYDCYNCIGDDLNISSSDESSSASPTTNKVDGTDTPREDL